MQIDTSTLVQGELMDPPPRPQSFCFVAVFRNAFDLVYKMKVYFMGGGAAGGLCRHQQWSPPWPPSWILLRIRNRLKPRKMATFLLQMKNNT